MAWQVIKNDRGLHPNFDGGEGFRMTLNKDCPVMIATHLALNKDSELAAKRKNQPVQIGSALVVVPPSLVTKTVNDPSLYLTGLPGEEMHQIDVVNNKSGPHMNYGRKKFKMSLSKDCPAYSDEGRKNNRHKAFVLSSRLISNLTPEERDSLMTFERIFIDEAQMCRNCLKNDLGTGLRALLRDDHTERWLMTGTPAYYSLLDYYGLLGIMRLESWSGSQDS